MRQALIVSLCGSYVLFCLLTMPAAPIAAPDSAGYLGFAPIRALGYPLFVKVLGAKGAIVAQPVLFAIALAWLGLEALRATSSLLLAAGIVLASISVPDLRMYHASILTESLFMTGLVMFLAAAIRFVREPSPANAALAAILAGLTPSVRGTGLPLLPVLPIMVLLQWRRLAARRASTLAVAIVPALALVVGERFIARAVHRENLTSLMGRHAYAKAALIEAPPPPMPSPDPLRASLEKHLDVACAPIRDLINGAPSNLRVVLTVYYEVCLQGPCVPELGRTGPSSQASVNDVLASVAFERIARAPLEFATLTARHYRSLWTVNKAGHPGTAAAVNAFIASHRPLPFERDAFALRPEDTGSSEFRPYEPVRFVQPIVIVIGWLTGGFALLGLAAAVSLWRLSSQALAVACLASLTAHGGLLFSALFAPGISRYTIGMWPAIMTAVLFGAWWAWSDMRTRRRSPISSRDPWRFPPSPSPSASSCRR